MGRPGPCRDFSNHHHRLATFVDDRETVYSGEFDFAWGYCRGLAVEDANEPPWSGLLAQPAKNAGGRGVPTRPLLGGLQGAVTREIEKFDARELDSKIRALLRTISDGPRTST